MVSAAGRVSRVRARARVIETLLGAFWKRVAGLPGKKCRGCVRGGDELAMKIFGSRRGQWALCGSVVMRVDEIERISRKMIIRFFVFEVAVVRIITYC